MSIDDNQDCEFIHESDGFDVCIWDLDGSVDFDIASGGYWHTSRVDRETAIKIAKSILKYFGDLEPAP